MKKGFWPRTAIGLFAMMGFAAGPTVQALSPAPGARGKQVPPGKEATTQKDKLKTEPTFEETKDFILRYTRSGWQDAEGNAHTCSLSFADRKLKYIHRFTSKFKPGFVEKIEVLLSDLDPALVGKEEQDESHISLATTDGERKIAIEMTMTGPTDGPQKRRYQVRSMAVPGAETESDSELEKMTIRLKRAWAHLIQRSGGRPSKEEPF